MSNECKCGNEAEDFHTCPYKNDINNDCKSKCNCCDECTQKCSDDR